MRVFGSVDCSAIRHNLSVVRQLAPHARIMAVVKSNAYGHGLVQVAQALNSSVEAFAVATVDEAITLREADIQGSICVLSGFSEADHVAEIRKYEICVVLYCQEQIQILKRIKLDRPIDVWLKINTGMNRLGFSVNSVQSVFHELKSSSFVSIQGVMSHFACADEIDSDFTTRQINRLKIATENIEIPLSIANSPAILKWPKSHLDWVRPGIMLYGASPFSGSTGEELGLRPAMTVYSKVVAINTLSKGESIGYGLTWQSSDSIRVGIVACGYGDGFARCVSPGTQVMINDVRAEIIGRISMDTFAVNLSDCPTAKVGTLVKLFGHELPVEELAAATGTIPYETLCSIQPRRINLRYT